MKPRTFRFLLVLTLVEAIFILASFLYKTSEPETARLFGYSYVRLGLAAVLLAVIALLAYLSVQAFWNGTWCRTITGHLTAFLSKRTAGFGETLFMFQGALLLGIVMAFEGFALTYLQLSPHLRPFFVWAALICMQTWLALRIDNAPSYQKKPSLLRKIRMGWQTWGLVQKKVFITLVIIGLVYFAAFIPLNTHKLAGDEKINYPDIIRPLTLGDSLKSTFQNLLVNENWWYGQPLYFLSTIVLLIPRLVFGQGFAEQITLNMLLLRQFISVLPMILSIFTLTYLVTRFRSFFVSVGMYVFLLLIPGVVKYNAEFWHPDSLILLLTVLTIFFLSRDRLQFGKNYYLAAVACGLSIALKLWGFFFFLTIAGYLIAGLLKKRILFKKAVLAGVLFIAVMLLTVLITSPSLLVHWSYDMMVFKMGQQNYTNMHGYPEPDPQGVYRTGLKNWMIYFELYYLRAYFFYFLFIALAVGSLVGTERTLNRILLSWCLVTAAFLVTFYAVKSFHYMLPMMLPLHAAAFLFPSIVDGEGPAWLSFLKKPFLRKVAWGISLAMVGSETIFNILAILSNPIILGLQIL